MVLKTRLQKASSAQAVCMAVWKAVLAVCLQDGARERGGGCRGGTLQTALARVGASSLVTGRVVVVSC